MTETRDKTMLIIFGGLLIPGIFGLFMPAEGASFYSLFYLIGFSIMISVRSLRLKGCAYE